MNLRQQINDALFDVEYSVRVIRQEADRSHNAGARADRARKTLPPLLRDARRNLDRLETLLAAKANPASRVKGQGGAK